MAPPPPPPKRPGHKAPDHAPHHGGEHEEEHVEEANERWLVAYADMMTLLFGFFVLMYSMSKVDSEKFQQTAASTAEAFGGQYQNPTENINKAIAQEIKAVEGAAQNVEIKQGAQGLEISFRGQVLFGSGEASLAAEGQKILLEVAKQIKANKKVDFSIRVEGHTDDIPIATTQFPSNWELSAARAISVVKLFREAGLNADLLEAIGYADTRPLVPNRAPSGQLVAENMAQNRRVVIKIQRIYK